MVSFLNKQIKINVKKKKDVRSLLFWGSNIHKRKIHRIRHCQIPLKKPSEYYLTRINKTRKFGVSVRPTIISILFKQYYENIF